MFMNWLIEFEDEENDHYPRHTTMSILIVWSRRSMQNRWIIVSTEQERTETRRRRAAEPLTDIIEHLIQNAQNDAYLVIVWLMWNHLFAENQDQYRKNYYHIVRFNMLYHHTLKRVQNWFDLVGLVQRSHVEIKLRGDQKKETGKKLNKQQVWTSCIIRFENMLN